MDLITKSAERGVFRRQGVMDPVECKAICAEMRESAVRLPGCVLDRDNGHRPSVHEPTRRTSEVEVSDRTIERTRALINSAAPDIGRHFGMTNLSLRYECLFVLYQPGDYFVFHKDRDPTREDEPVKLRGRRISTLMYLNDASDEPSQETFCGGALRFLAHDLDPVPANERRLITFKPQAGLLVAFDPRVRHEVQPVTHGNRYAVVAWLY